MSVSVNGTNGLTFNDGSTQNTSPFAGGLGFRNRIINGACMIDQRNGGASVTPAATGVTYTLDRFFYATSQASKFTIQQNAGSVTPPSGFSNYVGLTVASAYSIGTSDYFIYGQAVEGFNMADLGWGTANAQAVTLSFWVRSSLTGVFGGSLKNSSGTQSYPFSYTINSANTWQQIVLQIPGNITGTWLTNNGVGVVVQWSLGMGSSMSATAGIWQSGNYNSATGATSVVGTNGATFYITGVQLEKGSTATSFDYRPYGTELALCQRYYWRLNAAYFRAYQVASSALGQTINYPVKMRANPTATKYGSWYAVNCNQPTFTDSGGGDMTLSCVMAATTTATADALYVATSTSTYADFSAEL